MKRKSYTRKSKKRTTRRARKQRGGSKIDFKVLLLSNETISEETTQSVKNVLETVFGSTGLDMEDKYIRANFVGLTGIPENLAGDGVIEFVYTPPPPSFLQNTRLTGERKLTALEGMIGDALLKSGLNVSLIPQSHGIYDDNLYYIALCTPKCWSGYTKGLYQKDINIVKKAR